MSFEIKYNYGTTVLHVVMVDLVYVFEFPVARPGPLSSNQALSLVRARAPGPSCGYPKCPDKAGSPIHIRLREPALTCTWGRGLWGLISALGLCGALGF